MPDMGLSDDSLANLGKGVRNYFREHYPTRGITLSDRVRALIDHYGSRRAAARAAGVSASTLIRWARGTPPKKETRRRADRAYLKIHLQVHGWRPTSRWARVMGQAFSDGLSDKEIGKLAEKIMCDDNRVPKTAIFPNPVTFSDDMGVMDAPGCEISNDTQREIYPFRVGKY